MATHYADISAALDSRLNDLGVPVAWENVSHFPADDIWIQTQNMTTDTTQAELGRLGADRTIGIYILKVWGKAGLGKGAIIRMADTVCDHFPRGGVYSNGGVDVRIRRNRIGQITSYESKVMMAVEIYYEAYTAAR
jgi:hypothetical protein